MKRKSNSGFVFALLAAFVGLRSAPAPAADIPLTSSLPIQQTVLISVTPSLGPRIPFIGDGTAHLAYELYLSNYSRKSVRIVALRVHGSRGSAFEVSIEGDTLKDSFIEAAAANRGKPHDPVLAPGAAGSIYIFLNFGSRKTPTQLDNSIVAETEGEVGNEQLIPIATVAVEAPAAAATIDAPFAGDRWQAANGPSNTSLHRRAVIVLDGQAKSPERYAIDWIKLGDDGNNFTGDEHQNSSYHAYDTPIIAVADGRAVTVLDGIPENIPHREQMAITMTAATMAGNSIVEDIGGGRYVGYAHFRPGTITVKTGDTIHRGQVLGKLGNSGNSTEPHLHLQICDGPTFLTCNGLPMQFQSMMLSKYRIEKQGEKPIRLTIDGAPRDVAGQEPMEDELVTFSGQ